jgi:hypothetical protein
MNGWKVTEAERMVGPWIRLAVDGERIWIELNPRNPLGLSFAGEPQDAPEWPSWPLTAPEAWREAETWAWQLSGLLESARALAEKH